MLYTVYNTVTNEAIISYDIAIKANKKAEELNKKYNTTIYSVR